MYGGYNNYGMGGGRGQGQGQEMYMIMCVCCVCLVCLGSLAVAYFTGALGKMGIGGSTTDPMPEDMDMATPDTAAGAGAGAGGGTGVVTTCSSAYASQSRGNNDPRPALKAESCVSAGPQTGRDCYYWQTKPDPLTNLARWERVPDPNNPEQDSYNKNCKATVSGPLRVKFNDASMAGYTDNKIDDLLKLFKPKDKAAATAVSMIPLVTSTARKYGVRNWGDSQSRTWVSAVSRSFQGRNISPHINNSGLAVQTVKAKLNLATLSAATYATILEAAVNSPSNQADWINSVATNSWAKNPRSAGGRALPVNEAGYIQYLRWATKGKVRNWTSAFKR